MGNGMKNQIWVLLNLVVIIMSIYLYIIWIILFDNF